MPKIVSVVFVNYRDYESLSSLLQAQLPLPPNLNVVIVDNTENEHRDEATLAIWRDHQRVSVLTPGNVGYMGAARIAAERHAEVLHSDFVILANSDLEFNFIDLYEALTESSSLEQWSSANVGIIAPCLFANHAPARQLHYATRPSSAHFERVTRIYRWYPAAVIHRLLGDVKRTFRSGLQTMSMHAGESIFAPHGAMMIFTQKYLQLQEPFGYPEFLFCEEIFVGLKASENGLLCSYVPRITYSHRNHGSMGRVQSRKVITYLYRAHKWAAQALRTSVAYEGDRNQAPLG